MATSGRISTGAYKTSSFYVNWQRTGYNAAENYSDINWQAGLNIGGYDEWYRNAVRVNAVWINGAQVSGAVTVSNIMGAGDHQICSGSTRVYHNADGTKTMNIAISGWLYSYGDLYADVPVTLDTIPRYAKITSFTVSKDTETTLRFNWSTDATVDYIWISDNGGSGWVGVNVADGTSGSYIRTGRAANTKYNCKIRVRRKDSQLTTESGVYSQTTYNYPYANSMPNFNIGDKLTIGLYNPLKRSVRVNILGQDGSQISNDTTSGTSISGYQGAAVTNALYASIPNAKSGKYKVKVTYGSQVKTNNGGTYTAKAADCSPSIGAVTYQDTNTTTTDVTQNNQNIVQLHSKVQFNATGLTAIKSATVKSCKVTVNAVDHAMTLSGSTATVNNVTIDSSSNVTATVTVTDSRGFTATKNVEVNMLAWSLPTAIITIRRHNNFYSETDINVDADYSSIDSKNAVVIEIRHKKTTETDYSDWETVENNETTVHELDNNYAWDIQVKVTDKFGSTTYNLSLSRGMPIIYYDRILSSTGFNCFPTEEKSVEVNGTNVLKSVATMCLAAKQQNLPQTTYSTIDLTQSNVAGTRLTADESQHGIVVGKGVSKVLVSANVHFESHTTAGYRHVRIIKNEYTTANTLAWSNERLTADNVGHQITITPILADVTEGDVIKMIYYPPSPDDVLSGETYGYRTSLTVEVVE
ncbi:hypothetical protein [Megamonas hypermegale]|uniref:hypothetical protein n=1 Tax=Megamonas hypermegale TaxID=158847 RepID=UPI0026EBC9B5|nr:hypothetical protein [Megamonas hypermegale]